MNLEPNTPNTPTQTDPQLDALLDQALDAGQIPSDLQDRILAITDPAMNALLDQALAPDATPQGMDARILQRLNEQATTDPSPILATIGPPRTRWTRYAAAAAILIAASTVFYFVNSTRIDDPAPIVVSPQFNTGAEESLALLEADTSLDTEIDTLQNRIITVADQPLWGGEDDFQRELWQEIAPEEESIAMLF